MVCPTPKEAAMRSQHYKMTVSFWMQNGQELSVEWTESRWEGTYEDPPEVEASECEVFIDGNKVETLPKGLDKIVDAMYFDPYNPRFSAREEDLGYW